MWLWCAEQAMRSKSSSNTPPWPLHWLLPSGSWSIWVLLTSFEDELRCGSINQINSFFPNLLGLVLQQRNVNSKTSWDHKWELVLKSRLPLFHFTSGFSLNFHFFFWGLDLDVLHLLMLLFSLNCTFPTLLLKLN